MHAIAWVHISKSIGAVIASEGKDDMECPRCGRETEWLRTPSRTDSKTMICDDCGTREYLEAAGLTKEADRKEH